MNYRQIEVFFEVMNEGSITAAAKKLGISQPSVTTTIKQAEERLKFKLFEREGGRLIPTAEARILNDEASLAHEALTAFERLADKLRDGISGHVKIAATSSLCLEIIPEAVCNFINQYPHYSIDISTHNTDTILRGLDARSGTYNIGFTFGTGNYDGLSSMKIGNVDLYCLYPASWKFDKNNCNILQRLNGKPFISPISTTPLGSIVNSLLLKHEVEPNIVATVHAHQLALDLVKRRVGFTILDTITVHALLNASDKHLVNIQPITLSDQVPVTAIFPGGRTLSNPSKSFVEGFRTSFRKLVTRVKKEL